jgi:hypothetical protein
MRSAGRQRERRARGDDEQAPLRVEHVRQREQVVLVGAAAVQEDEQTLRLGGGRPGAVDEAHAFTAGRGFGSGVSSGSTCSRMCS